SYKLIHHFGTKQEYKPLNGRSVSELYDLENDPDELLNLAETQPELAERMLNDLRVKMKQEGAS
nr:acetylglucosamine-6-sulfatase [Anaerolineae bacterium]